MILFIQVVWLITHILRKNQENGKDMVFIGNKEINLILYIFLEEKIGCLMHKLLNSSESADEI
jgi:hypothetical protein